MECSIPSRHESGGEESASATSTSSSSDNVVEEANLNNGTVIDGGWGSGPVEGTKLWPSDTNVADATEGTKTTAVDVAGNLYSGIVIDDASVIEGTKWSSPTVVKVAGNLYSGAAIDAASSGEEGDKYLLLM